MIQLIFLWGEIVNMTMILDRRIWRSRIMIENWVLSTFFLFVWLFLLLLFHYLIFCIFYRRLFPLLWFSYYLLLLLFVCSLLSILLLCLWISFSNLFLYALLSEIISLFIHGKIKSAYISPSIDHICEISLDILLLCKRKLSYASLLCMFGEQSISQFIFSKT